MSDRYVLIGHEVVRCDDLIEWAMQHKKMDRGVAKDRIADVDVSTVFLGIDHQCGIGPPLLFETMTFGPEPFNELCERCSTWEEAEQQHNLMCAKVRKHMHDGEGGV